MAGADVPARGGVLAESKPPMPLSSDVASATGSRSGGMDMTGAVTV